MREESELYLARAWECLAEARKIADIGLAGAAARSAYYAAFHAAEALIFSKTGRAVKSHSGLRATFARLAVDIPELDKTFTTFLARAYKFKEANDYAIGGSSVIALVDAQAAIEEAERFVRTVETVLNRS